MVTYLRVQSPGSTEANASLHFNGTTRPPPPLHPSHYHAFLLPLRCDTTVLIRTGIQGLFLLNEAADPDLQIRVFQNRFNIFLRTL
jgi:hypothetical protein